MRKGLRGWMWGLVCLLALGGCRPTQPALPEESLQVPAGMVQYARFLRIDAVGDSLRLAMPVEGGQDTFRLTVPRQEVLPLRCVVLSTTLSAMFEHLGAADRLVGISQADYLYSHALRQRIAQGTLAAVAPGGTLNLEVLLALRPTHVLTGGEAISAADSRRLAAAGIRLLPVQDWQEEHPLGRCEWLLLVGALTGRFNRALAYRDSVAAAYTELATRARAQPHRPTVISGSPYNEVWYLPGGKSYPARLLADAGAQYPWAADSHSGSLALSLEQVLPHALVADYWLNPGQVAGQAEIETRYPRLRSCRPFRTRHLYGYYARVTPQGGNDYFERGVLEPDVVLKDLIGLFHPHLVPGHSGVYYRHMP